MERFARRTLHSFQIYLTLARSMLDFTFVIQKMKFYIKKKRKNPTVRKKKRIVHLIASKLLSLNWKRNIFRKLIFRYKCAMCQRSIAEQVEQLKNEIHHIGVFNCKNDSACTDAQAVSQHLAFLDAFFRPFQIRTIIKIIFLIKKLKKKRILQFKGSILFD